MAVRRDLYAPSASWQGEVLAIHFGGQAMAPAASGDKPEHDEERVALFSFSFSVPLCLCGSTFFLANHA
jgi:hypothetical protein